MSGGQRPGSLGLPVSDLKLATEGVSRIFHERTAAIMNDMNIPVRTTAGAVCGLHQFLPPGADWVGIVPAPRMFVALFPRGADVIIRIKMTGGPGTQSRRPGTHSGIGTKTNGHVPMSALDDTNGPVDEYVADEGKSVPDFPKYKHRGGGRYCCLISKGGANRASLRPQ